MEKNDNLNFCDSLKKQLNESLKDDSNKVAIKIIGGLGKQMFQYAFARCYARKYSKSLYLDTSYCAPKGEDKRPYQLGVFNLKAKIINDDDAREWKRKSRLPSLLRRFLGIKIYDDGKDFSYNPHVIENGNYQYLIGRFASEKYFEEYESDIREDFQFLSAPSAMNIKAMEKIRNENSVGIHVRCKPYTYTKRLCEVRGLCSFDYYMAAIKYITKLVEKPVFYIFSDDVDWVKENFKIDYPINIVDINDDTNNFEDLRLMSLCKHNIMANSFFSWWAAWLNNNKNKIVIAPEKWFHTKELDIKDLIPDSWIKM